MYEIYNSEEGFDLRFSGQGLWGHGTYFAVNASYSDSYSYRSYGRPDKSLFLARVLTGKSVTLMVPDYSLTKPPIKPVDESVSSLGLHQERFSTTRFVCLLTFRYDSVKGHTNGSDVFVVYANGVAYPEYIVYYR